jgi:hypothetical protein
VNVNLQATIERIKAEVLEDVGAGVVPADVASFGELHDHVDANCYGGAEEAWEEGDAGCDELCAYWNAAQGAVDEWIKAGGVRGAVGRWEGR